MGRGFIPVQLALVARTMPVWGQDSLTAEQTCERWLGLTQQWVAPSVLKSCAQLSISALLSNPVERLFYFE